MTDHRITKILAGNYRVGGLSVFRDRGKWSVQGAHRDTESYPTQRRAILAALIITGQATDAESNAFMGAK